MHDGMALIQSINSQAIPDTMAQLEQCIYVFPGNEHAFSSNQMRVDFVCGTYTDMSIKNAEQSRRANGDVFRTKILHSDHPCLKQWKRYLFLGKNKEELIDL